jgi:hypothetical protein
VPPDAQVAAIAASIKEWGWTTPTLVGEDGGLIAGHARVLAARANTSPPSTRARARAREAAGNQRPWPADKVERWPIDRRQHFPSTDRRVIIRDGQRSLEVQDLERMVDLAWPRQFVEQADQPARHGERHSAGAAGELGEERQNCSVSPSP